MEPGLSIVVLTKNEEDNIEDCLRSVNWADERIVLDCFSEDRTVELAAEMGARVVQREWTNYADQRNAAFGLLSNPWVFFVDADERASEELGEEVKRRIRGDTVVGWWVPRRNYIWGKWVRHAGWYPDYQLRVLLADKARYDPSRAVHEVVNLDGDAGHLENPLVHYNYDTVAEFIAKQDRYADYDARILCREGVEPKAYRLVLQPLREIRRRYVTLAGYKDGLHGLLLSVLLGYYTFLVHWRLRRIWPTCEST